MHGKRDDAPQGVEPSQGTQDPVNEGATPDLSVGSVPKAAEGPEGTCVSPDGSATPGCPKAGKDAEIDLSARIASLEAELADLNDRHLRKVADLENYRKRMAREMEDIRLYANTEILLDLVSLLDDFDRAIQSSETGKDWKSLHDGVIMIQRAFLSKLEGLPEGLRPSRARHQARQGEGHHAGRRAARGRRRAGYRETERIGRRGAIYGQDHRHRFGYHEQLRRGHGGRGTRRHL
jgi:molecular chaperone GrpE (heat shock protein)